jgi:hypothetical protein
MCSKTTKNKETTFVSIDILFSPLLLQLLTIRKIRVPILWKNMFNKQREFFA